MISTLKKRGQKKEAVRRGRYRCLCLTLAKDMKREASGKSKMKQGEKEELSMLLSPIEIFNSVLCDRAGVSVMPNRVIKGINLQQELICCTHPGIFIRHCDSVMNLLITTDMHYMDYQHYEVTIYVIKSLFIVYSYDMY